MCCEHGSVGVVLPAASPPHHPREEAICDRSPWTSTATSARWRSRTAARCARAGASRPAPTELELFAQSLAPDDQVALEASGPALQIARSARAPRRPGGDRQHPQGAGDRRGEGKDRQGRRPDALRAAGGRVSARGLRPRRADPGAAAPARPPRRARAPAHPGKERAARGARPQPQGPPADAATSSGSVGAQWLDGARAAGRRARDRRRLFAPGRLPRPRRSRRSSAGSPGWRSPPRRSAG